MKWLLILPGFLLLTITSVKAQQTQLFRSAIYTNRGKQINGLLYSVTDSTIQYIIDSSESMRQLRKGEPTIWSLPIAETDHVVIRRRRPVRVDDRILFAVSTAGSLAVLAIPGNGSWEGIFYRFIFRPYLLLSLPLVSLSTAPGSSILSRKIIRFNKDRNELANAQAKLSRFSYRPQSAAPELQKPVTTTQP